MTEHDNCPEVTRNGITGCICGCACSSRTPTKLEKEIEDAKNTAEYMKKHNYNY